MLRKLLSNQYMFSLITKFFLVTSGVLNSVFINRYLGPALKGEYAFVLNAVNLVVLILNLGIYQSYPNSKRNNLPNVKQKYYNICIMQFVVYLVLALVLSLIVGSIRYAIIFTLVPFNILTKQLLFITMIENINLRNAINIANQMLYTVMLAVLYVLAPRNYYYIIALLYIKDIIIVLRIIAKFDLRLDFKDMDLKLLAAAIKFGFFPMLTILLITMNYDLDILILKKFVDFEQIGYYSVGVSLANQVWVIPDAFKEVLFSKTASSDSIDDIVLSIKVNVYICLLIIGFIAIAGKQVLHLLYGVEYLQSYPVTVVLFFGVLPMVFFKLIYPLFIAKGRNKLSFGILLASVILNVIGNFIFIPIFGIIGAAVTSIFSYSLCGILFLTIFARSYNLNMRDLFLPNGKDIERLRGLIRKAAR